MRLRRVTLENVRSFLDRADLFLDGPISILIGPNGGGKTNLLDAVVVMLRRHLFASMYAVHQPVADHFDRYVFQSNDILNNMNLERHSAGSDKQQVVEVEIEATTRDIENMRSMQADAERLTNLAKRKYMNLTLERAKSWDVSSIIPGTRFTYRVVDGSLQYGSNSSTTDFLQYLQMFEMDGRLREEYELAPLATPLMYLPVNRSAGEFQSSVQLSGFNEFELKRQSDAAFSRSATQIVALAIGRLAKKFRLLLEKDQGVARREFHDDRSLKQMTELLHELGYDWTLESINPMTNQYDIRLKKQGSSFLVSAASSGERELLTYLFAIFALNVRDALIIVDEPELHLHPKWQKTLLRLFSKLAETTGNQFLLATHSPTFVSPESIQYVSRVFSRAQKSRAVRLDTATLPEAKHLSNIINSQNNERLFFADEVVLVEGLSDRIFFEAVLDLHGRASSSTFILEVVSVGGKGLFEAYGKILRACQIPYSIIADLDYVEQVGSVGIKSLFALNEGEIKGDVIDNVKSIDGKALVDSIENAIQSKSWGKATKVWEYIKSRRRELRRNLTEAEQTTLKSFIDSKKSERIYILERGALEAYLPIGHASKDLDKLIRLVADEKFWSHLGGEQRIELSSLAKALLRQSTDDGPEK